MHNEQEKSHSALLGLHRNNAISSITTPSLVSEQHDLTAKVATISADAMRLKDQTRGALIIGWFCIRLQSDVQMASLTVRTMIVYR